MDVANRARELYAKRLQAFLEVQHDGQFVAIEPDSGDHFVAATMREAIDQARAAHPDRLPVVIRIGSSATIELGVQQK